MSTIINLKPKTKKSLNVGVIIQARMTSKRFPGKSMALLLGKPVVQHVIERAKLIRPVSFVILAVPDTDESDPLIELADKLDIYNFCGSEENVLDRYYLAAMFFDLDIIVRITADCPFINPRVCSEILQLLLWRKCDYTSNVLPKRTYPKGLDCEAFTMDALEAAYKMADSAYDKEHVTPWMQAEKEVQKACVSQKINKSNINWCVDEPGDIARLEHLASKNKIMLIGANDAK